MIIINLQAMIFAKQVEWKRHITLKEVADTTGISRMTLHRMVKNPSYNACTEHLDKLCAYFSCEISALLHWQPNCAVRQVFAA
ncbi:helix-turn-helix domain-containing protein [Methylophilus medardicus]|uniref:Helix-turn-helix transcriptional regulator n=1 Tax=Methylophilus medardicus TaxID=2588534 RepID=A0A5B8CQM3_9PROT|nr:helix-turn-helix transcriptional regulator [Methylophilus medardicus]QDC43541.1 helix-turn-helix transcriptional regulator [Methylophilus medardicus]QDC48548.1 helix-turn-helix transcriptional regulator [Methylophilus medardicus]QDC52253.1 helix-turn-helix transcriptional regulator [Methylophilus medardicus]